ncbi:MAG: MFS transporter [Candidatus Bathyarchaeum sp.]|nr:MAG: MFS transporter [Candidatus Bathyarchaeum sp.]
MLLNLGALSWFFVFNNYMEETFTALTPNATDWGSHIGNSLFYGSIIFWSIAISFIGERINRRKLLFTSIILGILTTILLGLLEGTFFITIISVLMGTSLGLGLPSSMALVADYTIVENRGRISGIILLGTFIVASVSMGICGILELDILGLILLLSVLRSISIFALVMEKFDRPPSIGKKIRLHLYDYKDFFVYLCTFLLFSIASGLAWSLIPDNYEPQVAFGNTLRFVLMAVFGAVAGVMADRFGRKQPIIIGLAALGIGFLLGLGFNLSGESVILYLTLSGITWGSFFVVFLAVPGDLSFPSSREKFYAFIYIFPLFGQFLISIIPVDALLRILHPEVISQILGVFLFLAIYPVLRAKETLTESKIQERKMKEYVERVGKVIQETEEEK